MLREFAYQADRDVTMARWSFCRDLGPARLVMIDSRAARVLDPDNRAMVDDLEWEFIERVTLGTSARHLLIGTSLPWLLSPGLHHLEAWDEAVCEGAWGKGRLKRTAEKLRQALDLEHWAAFQDSFHRLTGLIGRAGAGTDGARPPATVVALSGDVHHAYLAEVTYPEDDGVRSRVYQATASPFRNPLDSKERRIMKAASSRPAAAVTRALARAARVRPSRIGWVLRDKPIFDNVVATLRLDGDDATLRLERARPTEGSRSARLEHVYETSL
jgi:hypothetical protein